MTAKSLEAQKRKLWTWYQARSAAGEKSLLSWGRDQKPPLTFGQVEQLADALVEDGVLTKERRGSGWVWLRVHDAELPESAPELELATPAPPAAAPSRPEPEPTTPPPAASSTQVESLPPPDQETPQAPDKEAMIAPAPSPSTAPLPAPFELLLRLDEELLMAVMPARRRLTKALSALEIAQREVAAAQAALEAIARGEKPAEASPTPAASRPVAATGTCRARVLQFFKGTQPGQQVASADIAAALMVDRTDISGPLSTLTSDGLLERPARGLYRITSKGRNADG